MASAWHLSLSLLHWVTLVHSFNMDTKHPTIIHGEIASHFGYKVLQFGSEKDPGILVSAPLERNTTENVTGALYKCDYHSRACHPIPIPGRPESQIDGVGLSLAVDPRTPSKLLLCAPSLSYSCGLNKYLNGICYQFDSSLALSRNFTPAFQGCPEKELDVAFLIDGSGSISASDFTKMKRFMLKVMELLKGEQVQFAVAQYSDETRKEFNFRDYRKSPHPWVLIEPIEQMNSITFTPSGIKFVAEKIFREDQGARTTATWVMIVITDGESNDVDVTFPDAIAAAKKKNILRYAIGVGDAFSTQRATEELNIIASKPSVDFVLKVNNFAALENINEKLKEKIFAIEGTGNSSGKSSFHLEMAQAGFSAIFEEDAIVLGAVGANDWSGALVKVQDGQEEVIQDSTLKDMAESYLGYSIVKATLGSQSFSVVGAPRYKHRGQVVIFGPGSNRTKWEVKQRIEGDQIGSYFGVELSSVDLDGDGETDFLLIGAPLYHKSGIGGRVSFCPLSAQGNFSCTGTLRGVEGNGLGRFGSAIAALRDLNGDGLGDVAIGAPLEDEHRGSVYIYHGQARGISPRYSQRITGLSTVPGLKYFGQSIDGRMALTRDGLTDLVVGALGGAVILRSSPVLSVQTMVTFAPAEIPLASFGCPPSDRKARMEAALCFRVRKASGDGLASLSANLNYTLELDAVRQTSRAVFGAKQRASSHLVNVSLGENCFPHSISILACIEDYFNPIQLMLRFCVEGNPIPGLKTLSPAFEESCFEGLTWKLPFEKNCGRDQVCVSDLKISFNFSGADALIVQPTAMLNITVRLENLKEDSYRTVVKIFHPPGLSFRKVTVLKSNRKVSIACDDTGGRGQSKLTACNVNHPVFSENTEVIFVTSLDVSNTNTWNDKLSINMTAYSENEGNDTLDDNDASRVIPVQYSVYLLIKGSDSVNYVNFSLKSNARKEVEHIYRVENFGRLPLPVSITFIVPLRLGPHIIWNVSGVTTDQVSTNRIDCDVRGKVGGQAGVAGAQANKDCGAEVCQAMVCAVESLVQKVPLMLALRGELFLTNGSQTEPATYLLQSVGRLDFDQTKYIQAGDAGGGGRLPHSSVSTDVELFKELDYIPWISGGAAGGLVLLALVGLLCYKVGFFKRRYRDCLTESNAQKAGEEGCEEPLNSSPAKE